MIEAHVHAVKSMSYFIKMLGQGHHVILSCTHPIQCRKCTLDYIPTKCFLLTVLHHALVTFHCTCQTFDCRMCATSSHTHKKKFFFHEQVINCNVRILVRKFLNTSCDCQHKGCLCSPSTNAKYSIIQCIYILT